MRFARENKQQILKMYEEGCSSYEIADQFGTYSTKILRALKFLGAEKRNYSDAQKIALKRGRSKAPIEKGSKLTEEHKFRVSEGRAKAWSETSDEERERLSQISKDNWLAMSEEEKQNLRTLAAQAVREAATEGSKTEKFLRKSLTEQGWTVRFHERNLIPDNKLEVDLYISDIKTAVEVDGPSHFLPIWGEESLQRHQKSDVVKTGLLINEGYVLIRIKQMTKSLSQKKMRIVLDGVVDELNKIADSFPDKENRLIEIEV